MESLVQTTPPGFHLSPVTDNPPWLLRRQIKYNDTHAYGKLPKTTSASQKAHTALNLHDLQHVLRALESDSHLQLSVQDIIFLLKKCRDNGDYVPRLYACIKKRGLEKQLSIANGLIFLLIESGNICEAHNIFDKLECRNETSWTTLISGYTRCGKPHRAMALYHIMQEDVTVSPGGYTFVAILKACTGTRDVDCGYAIHSEVLKLGFDIDLFVGNTLIHMYAKLGLIVAAENVFPRLPTRDSVSWNAIITGYTEHGYGEEALLCFDQMKMHGFSPTAATYVCTLRACGAIKATERGVEIHEEITKNKMMYQEELSIRNALVGMYAKCGMLSKAKEEFDKLVHRDSVAWTALISGYIEDGHGSKALECFNEMLAEEAAPDNVTFLCIVKACGITGDVKQGQEVHINISKRGLVEGDLAIGNALVDMYARCGYLSEMQALFDQLLSRDIVSWNALLSGYVEYGCNETFLYFEQMQRQGFAPDATTLVCILKACSSISITAKCQELHIDIWRKGFLEDDLPIGNALVDAYGKCGLLAEAKKVFNNLPNRDVVSWNVLISAYVESGDNAEVFKYYEEMQLEHLSPDAVTYSAMLRVCANIGCLEKGKGFHVEIVKMGLVDNELVNKALVDMYIKCGCLREAQEVFEGLPLCDIVVWTSLITGYAQFGDCRSVYDSCGRMIMDGVMPNLITFFAILNVCSHSGLVNTGQSYFEIMIRNYNILPTLEHYTCIIDLYSRAGQIENAVAVTKKMPLSPDLAIWHIVLGACQKWGNVEVGALAFEHAVKLSEEDRTSYICLSNIYAFAWTQNLENI